MGGQKGLKDLQCSVLSLHFSSLIIYVFKMILKLRQDSVSALISPNANAEMCNSPRTAPARSAAKRSLRFHSRPVVLLAAEAHFEDRRLNVPKLSLPSSQ